MSQQEEKRDIEQFAESPQSVPTSPGRRYVSVSYISTSPDDGSPPPTGRQDSTPVPDYRSSFSEDSLGQTRTMVHVEQDEKGNMRKITRTTRTVSASSPTGDESRVYQSVVRRSLNSEGSEVEEDKGPVYRSELHRLSSISSGDVFFQDKTMSPGSTSLESGYFERGSSQDLVISDEEKARVEMILKGSGSPGKNIYNTALIHQVKPRHRVTSEHSIKISSPKLSAEQFSPTEQHLHGIGGGRELFKDESTVNSTNSETFASPANKGTVVETHSHRKPLTSTENYMPRVLFLERRPKLQLADIKAHKSSTANESSELEADAHILVSRDSEGCANVNNVPFNRPLSIDHSEVVIPSYTRQTVQLLKSTNRRSHEGEENIHEPAKKSRLSSDSKSRTIRDLEASESRTDHKRSQGSLGMSEVIPAKKSRDDEEGNEQEHVGYNLSIRDTEKQGEKEIAPQSSAALPSSLDIEQKAEEISEFVLPSPNIPTDSEKSSSVSEFQRECLEDIITGEDESLHRMVNPNIAEEGQAVVLVDGASGNIEGTVDLRKFERNISIENEITGEVFQHPEEEILFGDDDISAVLDVSTDNTDLNVSQYDNVNYEFDASTPKFTKADPSTNTFEMTDQRIGISPRKSSVPTLSTLAYRKAKDFVMDDDNECKVGTGSDYPTRVGAASETMLENVQVSNVPPPVYDANNDIDLNICSPTSIVRSFEETDIEFKSHENRPMSPRLERSLKHDEEDKTKANLEFACDPALLSDEEVLFMLATIDADDGENEGNTLKKEMEKGDRSSSFFDKVRRFFASKKIKSTPSSSMEEMSETKGPQTNRIEQIQSYEDTQFPEDRELAPHGTAYKSRATALHSMHKIPSIVIHEAEDSSAESIRSTSPINDHMFEATEMEEAEISRVAVGASVDSVFSEDMPTKEYETKLPIAFSLGKPPKHKPLTKFLSLDLSEQKMRTEDAAPESFRQEARQGRYGKSSFYRYYSLDSQDFPETIVTDQKAPENKQREEINLLAKGLIKHTGNEEAEQLLREYKEGDVSEKFLEKLKAFFVREQRGHTFKETSELSFKKLEHVKDDTHLEDVDSIPSNSGTRPKIGYWKRSNRLDRDVPVVAPVPATSTRLAETTTAIAAPSDLPIYQSSDLQYTTTDVQWSPLAEISRPEKIPLDQNQPIEFADVLDEIDMDDLEAESMVNEYKEGNRSPNFLEKLQTYFAMRSKNQQKASLEDRGSDIEAECSDSSASSFERTGLERMETFCLRDPDTNIDRVAQSELSIEQEPVAARGDGSDQVGFVNKIEQQKPNKSEEDVIKAKLIQLCLQDDMEAQCFLDEFNHGNKDPQFIEEIKDYLRSHKLIPKEDRALWFGGDKSHVTFEPITPKNTPEGDLCNIQQTRLDIEDIGPNESRESPKYIDDIEDFQISEALAVACAEDYPEADILLREFEGGNRSPSFMQKIANFFTTKSKPFLPGENKVQSDDDNKIDTADTIELKRQGIKKESIRSPSFLDKLRGFFIRTDDSEKHSPDIDIQNLTDDEVCQVFEAADIKDDDDEGKSLRHEIAIGNKSPSLLDRLRAYLDKLKHNADEEEQLVEYLENSDPDDLDDECKTVLAEWQKGNRSPRFFDRVKAYFANREKGIKEQEVVNVKGEPLLEKRREGRDEITSDSDKINTVDTDEMNNQDKTKESKRSPSFLDKFRGFFVRTDDSEEQSPDIDIQNLTDDEVCQVFEAADIKDDDEEGKSLRHEIAIGNKSPSLLDRLRAYLEKLKYDAEEEENLFEYLENSDPDDLDDEGKTILAEWQKGNRSPRFFDRLKAYFANREKKGNEKEFVVIKKERSLLEKDYSQHDSENKSRIPRLSSMDTSPGQKKRLTSQTSLPESFDEIVDIVQRDPHERKFQNEFQSRDSPPTHSLIIPSLKSKDSNDEIAYDGNNVTMADIVELNKQEKAKESKRSPSFLDKLRGFFVKTDGSEEHSPDIDIQNLTDDEVCQVFEAADIKDDDDEGKSLRHEISIGNKSPSLLDRLRAYLDKLKHNADEEEQLVEYLENSDPDDIDDEGKTILAEWQKGNRSPGFLDRLKAYFVNGDKKGNEKEFVVNEKERSLLEKDYSQHDSENKSRIPRLSSMDTSPGQKKRLTSQTSLPESFDNRVDIVQGDPNERKFQNEFQSRDSTPTPSLIIPSLKSKDSYDEIAYDGSNVPIADTVELNKQDKTKESKRSPSFLDKLRGFFVRTNGSEEQSPDINIQNLTDEEVCQVFEAADIKDDDEEGKSLRHEIAIGNKSPSLLDRLRAYLDKLKHDADEEEQLVEYLENSDPDDLDDEGKTILAEWQKGNRSPRFFDRVKAYFANREKGIEEEDVVNVKGEPLLEQRREGRDEITSDSDKINTVDTVEMNKQDKTKESKRSPSFLDKLRGFFVRSDDSEEHSPDIDIQNLTDDEVCQVFEAADVKDDDEEGKSLRHEISIGNKSPSLLDRLRAYLDKLKHNADEEEQLVEYLENSDPDDLDDEGKTILAEWQKGNRSPGFLDRLKAYFVNGEKKGNEKEFVVNEKERSLQEKDYSQHDSENKSRIPRLSSMDTSLGQKKRLTSQTSLPETFDKRVDIVQGDPHERKFQNEFQSRDSPPTPSLIIPSLKSKDSYDKIAYVGSNVPIADTVEVNKQDKTKESKRSPSFLDKLRGFFVRTNDSEEHSPDIDIQNLTDDEVCQVFEAVDVKDDDDEGKLLRHEISIGNKSPSLLDRLRAYLDKLKHDADEEEQMVEYLENSDPDDLDDEGKTILAEWQKGNRSPVIFDRVKVYFANREKGIEEEDVVNVKGEPLLEKSREGRDEITSDSDKINTVDTVEMNKQDKTKESKRSPSFLDKLRGFFVRSDDSEEHSRDIDIQNLTDDEVCQVFEAADIKDDDDEGKSLRHEISIGNKSPSLLDRLRAYLDKLKHNADEEERLVEYLENSDPDDLDDEGKTILTEWQKGNRSPVFFDRLKDYFANREKGIKEEEVVNVKGEPLLEKRREGRDEITSDSDKINTVDTVEVNKQDKTKESKRSPSFLDKLRGFFVRTDDSEEHSPDIDIQNLTDDEVCQVFEAADIKDDDEEGKSLRHEISIGNKSPNLLDRLRAYLDKLKHNADEEERLVEYLENSDTDDLDDEGKTILAEWQKGNRSPGFLDRLKAYFVNGEKKGNEKEFVVNEKERSLLEKDYSQHDSENKSRIPRLSSMDTSPGQKKRLTSQTSLPETFDKRVDIVQGDPHERKFQNEFQSRDSPPTHSLIIPSLKSKDSNDEIAYDGNNVPIADTVELNKQDKTKESKRSPSFLDKLRGFFVRTNDSEEHSPDIDIQNLTDDEVCQVFEAADIKDDDDEGKLLRHEISIGNKSPSLLDRLRAYLDKLKHDADEEEQLVEYLENSDPDDLDDEGKTILAEWQKGNRSPRFFDRVKAYFANREKGIKEEEVVNVKGEPLLEKRREGRDEITSDSDKINTVDTVEMNKQDKTKESKRSPSFLDKLRGFFVRTDDSEEHNQDIDIQNLTDDEVCQVFEAADIKDDDDEGKSLRHEISIGNKSPSLLDRLRAYLDKLKHNADEEERLVEYLEKSDPDDLDDEGKTILAEWQKGNRSPVFFDRLKDYLANRENGIEEEDVVNVKGEPLLEQRRKGRDEITSDSDKINTVDTVEMNKQNKTKDSKRSPSFLDKLRGFFVRTDDSEEHSPDIDIQNLTDDEVCQVFEAADIKDDDDEGKSLRHEIAIGYKSPSLLDRLRAYLGKLKYDANDEKQLVEYLENSDPDDLDDKGKSILAEWQKGNRSPGFFARVKAYFSNRENRIKNEGVVNVEETDLLKADSPHNVGYKSMDPVDSSRGQKRLLTSKTSHPETGDNDFDIVYADPNEKKFQQEFLSRDIPTIDNNLFDKNAKATTNNTLLADTVDDSLLLSQKGTLKDENKKGVALEDTDLNKSPTFLEKIKQFFSMDQPEKPEGKEVVVIPRAGTDRADLQSRVSPTAPLQLEGIEESEKYSLSKSPARMHSLNGRTGERKDNISLNQEEKTLDINIPGDSSSFSEHTHGGHMLRGPPKPPRSVDVFADKVPVITKSEGVAFSVFPAESRTRQSGTFEAEPTEEGDGKVANGVQARDSGIGDDTSTTTEASLPASEEGLRWARGEGMFDQKNNASLTDREEITQDGNMWYNRSEEIIKAAVGTEEFQKRLAKQNKMFDDGCKKGNIIDDISMYFKNGNLKSLMANRTKESGKRAIYADGVGALGYVVMDPDNQVPLNEFFCKGRVYEVRARHSSFPNAADDSRIGVRSLSVKFADHDFDSPMDLILATGCISPYFNSESIETFYKAMHTGNEALKRHFQTLPIYMAAALEGMRKNPDSFYHQHYHSQMVFDFKCKDEKRRLARFRVVPSDNSPESGRLSYEDQKDAWFNFLLPRESSDASPSYLKDEFVHRVKTAPVHYQLQIQFHNWDEQADTNMWYNPSIPWDAAEHKWLNLATINLNTIVSSDVAEMTRFNVGNLPRDTITFPEATSTDDFNFVPAIREYIYKEVAKLRSAEPSIPEKLRSTEYLIHTKTGPQITAGNSDQKCNVYVCLVGTEGRTSFRKLQRKYKADFDKGQKSTFSIIDKPIGDFLCMKVFKDKKGSKTDWFLEYMILTIPYTNKCYTLPCYRWFNDSTSLFSLRDGQAILAKDEQDEYIKLQRSLEVTERQRLVQWRHREADEDLAGFPGYIDAGSEYADLPADMRLDEMKRLENEWKKHAAGKNSFMKLIRSSFNFRKAKLTVEFENTVADTIARKENEELKTLEYVIRNWRKDEEFGRQMVNGVNPLKVVLLESIPANFPLTEADVQGLLEPAATIQSELGRRRLYLISYPELAQFVSFDRSVNVGSNNSSTTAEGVHSTEASQGPLSSLEQLPGSSTEIQGNSSSKKKAKPPKINPKEQPRYICAPMAILYQRNDNSIVPLAIQLTQEPSSPPLIYTKKDDSGEYSDWMLAKMWVRVADSTVQQLGVHLLGTHLVLEPISIALLRNFPLVHPVFKLLLPHLRRVVSLNTIYRKYLLPAIDGVFAEINPLGAQGQVKYLDLIQKEMNDFKFDLLDLPENLTERGVIDHKAFPGYYYRDDSLNLWDAIMDYVTEMLSIYYQDDADVETDMELANFLQGMPDIYSYAPNAPPAMMQPPPTSKNPQGLTEEQMKAILPHYELIERYIGAVLLMQGGYEKPEVKLGAFSERLFTEDNAQAAVRNFQKRLLEISEEIRQRNENLPVPYDYLLPENISNFIES